jgi:hypothetical protein
METPQKRRLYFGVQLSDSPLSTQNTTWKNKKMSHHPRGKKKDDPSLHGTPLIGCMEIPIPQIGCHYFWPQLSTVPRAIIPYNLFVAWLHYMRTSPY